MIRIAKRSENMLIKYLGWNSSFCQFVRGGSWKVENCGKMIEENYARGGRRITTQCCPVVPVYWIRCRLLLDLSHINLG